MAIWVIDDWQCGKKSRKGITLPPNQAPPKETVTVIPAPDAFDAFGCHNRRELVDWLRKLRSRGVLIAQEPGRLTSRVRRQTGGHYRAYVVRGGVQRYRPRRRVVNW